MNFASLVTQAKYQSVCEASAVHIVTPDWIIQCVEAMSRIDEMRYHPRLLITISQDFMHQALSAASTEQSLSYSNCQLDISDMSDTSLYVRPHVISATEKSVAIVPVTVDATTVVSQQHVRTYLKRTESEYFTEVCPLKQFSSTKVCIFVFVFSSNLK